MKEKEYDICDNMQKVILYQLLCKCELMYEYLTENGEDVSEEMGNDLTEINQKIAPIINNYKAQKSKGELDESSELKFQTDISNTLIIDKKRLTKLFNDLKGKCKPASPGTLKNTIPTHKMFHWFGSKVTLFMRTLCIVSIGFLIGYIIFGCLYSYNSGQWNLSQTKTAQMDTAKTQSAQMSSVQTQPSPMDMAQTKEKNNRFALVILQQLLLFFSAGLGACLFALITTKRYFIKRTFDNKYISYYYNRIITGIITGFILANIVDPSFFNSLFNSSVANSNTNAPKGIINVLTPSLLALLGGFSADAVIKILNRLVSMITTLVEGDTKDIIDSKEKELKNDFEAKKIKQNINYAVSLKSSLESANLDKDSELYKKIDDTINKLMVGNT